MVMRSITLLIVLTIGSFILMSCGKKAETTSLPNLENTQLPLSQIETYMAKQDVDCESNQACPNYIAKIVVVKGTNFSFCTGFLTDANTIATSTSCLPNLLRLKNQDCSKDVYFFFPKTWNRSAERAGCKRVIQVSDLEGSDPVLWRDDVSFLEMDKVMNYRRAADIRKDQEGINNLKNYTVWMIDQQDDYSAVVKKFNCEAIHDSYVNPLVINESSPNMVFADCPFKRGGTGAPLIDQKGKVRAMVSKGLDPKIRDYLVKTGLLNQGLKELFHATNFACAATPTNSTTLDERECRKDLTYRELDRARSEMLSTNILFGDLRKKFEQSLEGTSKYIRFGVKLIPKGDTQHTDIYPMCFKPFKDWVDSLGGVRNAYVDGVKLPVRSFRRSMDPYGRVLGTTLDAGPRETFVQFLMKSVRSIKKSSILIWNKGEDVRSLPDMLEECTASLE